MPRFLLRLAKSHTMQLQRFSQMISANARQLQLHRCPVEMLFGLDPIQDLSVLSTLLTSDLAQDGAAMKHPSWPK